MSHLSCPQPNYPFGDGAVNRNYRLVTVRAAYREPSEPIVDGCHPPVSPLGAGAYEPERPLLTACAADWGPSRPFVDGVTAACRLPMYARRTRRTMHFRILPQKWRLVESNFPAQPAAGFRFAVLAGSGSTCRSRLAIGDAH